MAVLSVRAGVALVNIWAKVNSFQERRNTIAKVAITAEEDMGSRILNIIPHRLRPSILAACSRLGERPEKVPIRSHTANGSVMVRWRVTSPICVPIRPSLE